MGGEQAGSKTTLLFVYGTLRRGGNHPMARLLASQARYLGRAQTAGRLYRIGSYPALTPARRGQEWVKGDLYELAESPGLLSRLDRYEGILPGRRGSAEYRRCTQPVVLQDGSRHLAWVYLYNRPHHGLPRLVSGDFLRQRRRPPSR